MSDPVTKLEKLEELAAEFIEAIRRGQPASLSRYLQEYPDLASEIEDLFPTILAMEQVKRDQERQWEPPRLPKEIAKYHIVHEVGRGGMGVVFAAKDKTTGERVALKILPPHFLANARALHPV